MTRSKLIEAAAKLFSDNGFQAVSVREIAQAAGVNPALVNYHFGSKQQLFEEVIRIYAADNVADRMTRLAQERRRLGRLELEDVVEIYLAPMIDPQFDTDSDGVFSRLHAVMIAERMEAFDQIAARAFTAVNVTFLDELERCLPHLTRHTITWRLFAMVGSMLYFGVRPAPPGLHLISKGGCDPMNREDMRKQLINYFIEGMRAPVR
ncbi:TetR/AcrR family transcriptional regulator [Roseinatronobacter alkalisoli]|uniref:TetR family transcriptional regulator n=1 Tax=Roseinatronobacter alkalisoli TaxID=3028235 RepID=A0ABT5TAM3_9RHOB|nr:TetR/AcrR family transcriptional regulator [Roseinatronobacter sp. HJB301]MDD7972179.1 TetR family transcriptional regulator [Roseinatronobacter sp. HJB301]